MPTSLSKAGGDCGVSLAQSVEHGTTLSKHRGHRKLDLNNILLYLYIYIKINRISYRVLKSS